MGNWWPQGWGNWVLQGTGLGAGGKWKESNGGQDWVLQGWGQHTPTLQRHVPPTASLPPRASHLMSSWPVLRGG